MINNPVPFEQPFSAEGAEEGEEGKENAEEGLNI